jgi:hypothetical protein
MVAKSFTISGLTVFAAVLSTSASAQAQSYSGVTAQANARVTIMRPAVLHVDQSMGHVETGATLAGSIVPHRTLGPCSADVSQRCALIIFDLP